MSMPDEPFALKELEIPGRTGPVSESPQKVWGINIAAALGNFPLEGLLCEAGPWGNMAEGDTLTISWGTGQNVWTEKVDKDRVGKKLRMYVPARHMIDGPYAVSYTVKPLGGADEPSEVMQVLVKLTRPGGHDDNDEIGHSKLIMTLPKEIVEGGIHKENLADVPITIGKNDGTPPYPYAAAGDVCRISWGGIYVRGAPLTQEQAEGKTPIIIEITKEIIKDAGDAPGVAVVFEVYDCVFNRSEDWSPEQRIEVAVDATRLGAPLLKETDNNVLDVDKLGDADGTVQILATDTSQFKVGDIPFIRIKGTPVEGLAIDLEKEYPALTNVPSVVEHTVPNAVLRQLAKAQITLSYRLKKTDAAPDLRSNSQFIRTIGEVQRLAAPLVLDEDSGALDPTLAKVRLEIPFDKSFAEDQVLKLFMHGKKPNLKPYVPDLPLRPITHNEIVAAKPLPYEIDGKYLTPVNGGTVKFFYQQLIAENVLATLDPFAASRAVRESIHTEVLQVGEPRLELPEPEVAGVVDGVLPADTDGTTLTAPYRETLRGDEVFMFWIGSITGEYTDSIKLSEFTAGQPVPFPIGAELIKGNEGGTVEARYEIKRLAGGTSYANSLAFVVGEVEEQLLSPAKVREAIDDKLDPANALDGATVAIPPNRPENAGDHFYMKWATTDGTVESEDDKSVSANNQGNEVEFTVDHSQVLASLNKTVIVSYRVELFEGGSATGENYELKVETQFKLPVATFLEATGAQKDQLNPDDVYPKGATVVIAASAQLKTDDEITVTITGKTSTDHPYTVLSTDAGKELTSIKIPHSRIDAEEGGEIALSYTVKRTAGGTDSPSDPTVYDVRKVIGNGTLRILGARYNRSSFRASGATRILSAFHATTGQPLSAEWKYPSDSQWTSATTWRDTAPQEPLQVRTADDLVTLNPTNIIGSGETYFETTGKGSFVALRDEGDVVGWGNNEYGADIPPTIITLDDIVEVSVATGAYAARRANNAVVAWGIPKGGGSMVGIDPFNFKQVLGNHSAFAGMKDTGRIVAWGDTGSSVPDAISNLTDIVNVTATEDAFVAQRATGTIVAWGGEKFGGVIPSNIAGLTDIDTLLGSFNAFAAHRANGRVVAWGYALNGGEVPVEIAGMTDIIELNCANYGAFTARRATGQIVAWGNEELGGTLDPLIAGLTDIVEVSSSLGAFAARRANGHVVAWGRPTEGGAVPTDIAKMDDIVQVCGAARAFAALRKNGTVVTWGNALLGGDSSHVSDQLTHVQALYSNNHGFVALTSDGRVVTWGDALAGGDSSTVQYRLQGKVSYLANASSRGLALRARQSLCGGPT